MTLYCCTATYNVEADSVEEAVEQFEEAVKNKMVEVFAEPEPQ